MPSPGYSHERGSSGRRSRRDDYYDPRRREGRHHSLSPDDGRRRGRSRDREPPQSPLVQYRRPSPLESPKQQRQLPPVPPPRGPLSQRSRSRSPRVRRSRKEGRNRREPSESRFSSDERQNREERPYQEEENRIRRRRNRPRRRRRREESGHSQRKQQRPLYQQQRRSNSMSPPSHRDPRTGIVSDDEDPGNHGRDPSKSPGSIHDDTVGHFGGGRGAVIAERYRVLEEVGVGTFGRVLGCLDLERSSRRNRPQGDEHCAIKIVRKVQRYYDSAVIEARIIREVNRRGGRGITHCVVLHDSFTFQGHYCMVFESLGPSLFDFLKRHNYQPFPMVCIQDFAVQLLETMAFLHSFSLIHTDLKIENILLMNDREINFDRRTVVPERTKIKLIDFGGACYDNSKKSTIINTRQYRSPEVILDTGWSMPSDMWSLGCILAELYQGDLLFRTHSNLEHLALMERMIGPFPRRLLKNANQIADEAFDSSGRHRMGKVLSPENEAFVLKSLTLEEIVRHPEDRWFLRLLRKILVFDPQERSTAHECLRYLHSVGRCHVRHA